MAQQRTVNTTPLNAEELQAARQLLDAVHLQGQAALEALAQLTGLQATVANTMGEIEALRREREAALEARDDVLQYVEDMKAVAAGLEPQIAGLRHEKDGLESQIARQQQRLDVLKGEVREALDELREQLKEQA